MLKRGRSCIAAFTACAILLVITAPAYPSYNTEAGHKYTIACQRLEDLRKSAKKKKYRSYWMDCIRTFELVEKKYPKSPSAADACFDQAGIYLDLYRYNRYSKDANASLQLFGKCQSTYPKHARAPEALYHNIVISLDYKKNNTLAADTYTKLSKTYPDSTWTKKARTRLPPTIRSARKQEPELRKMPGTVIAAQGKGKPDGHVKNVRYWSGGAYTRIVIDQDTPIKFRTQELKNPDRLVFDLLNTQLDPSVEKDPLPVNDGILRQVRSNQYAPDVVRVVLDLASIKSYAAFPLHDPERLVIDVTGEGGRTSETHAASAETGTQQNAESAETNTQAKAEPQQQTPPLPKLPEVKKNDNEKLSLSRQLGLKIKTIAIDAGHGGHDPGAIGRSGLKEKTITLDIAKRLAALVKERLGCNVVMTRDKDVFVPLEQRPFIAKSKGADLFVSIHVNANRKRKTRGIETYIQSLRASDRDAMATAARENAMSTKKLSQLKSELDRIFSDLAKDDKLEESLQLAHAVQISLVNNLKPHNSHVVDLKPIPKRAFFYVLINTEMPSILAEVGFISNPDEEKLLKKDSYRQAIAESLYQGVKQYVDARSPQMMGI
jgi:N-acetylmuramoyl-L-alanine amidase